MNHEVKEQQDQADQLRELLSEVQENSRENRVAIEDKPQEESYPNRDVDILNLPPRSEVHTENSGKVNLKLSKPLLRMVFVSFILLIVLIFVVYNWGIL